MTNRRSLVSFMVIIFLLALCVTPIVYANSMTGVALNADEQELLNLINRERAAIGLKPLAIDPVLSAVARTKSQDMADKNYFSQDSPTYGTTGDMLKSAGIRYARMAQNITTGGSVARAHGALMRMASSKANILDKGFDRIAIGVVRKSAYALYVTEIFIVSGADNPAPVDPTPEPEPVPTPVPDPEPEPEPPTKPEDPKPPVQPPVSGLTQEEQIMIQLINEERAKAGLPAYQVDMKLMEVARAKANDMVEKNYFNHYSPTYGDPVQMMRNAGISFRMGQENIAMATNITIAHTALMRSDSHRRAILNKYYTHVGVGIANMKYGVKVSQLFIVP